MSMARLMEPPDPLTAPRQPSLPPHLERLADFVQRYHLVTPALMLLNIARPLGFAGSQCLLLVQPLAPDPRWQARIGQTAAQLEDEAVWTHLENLLHCPAD